MQALDRETNQDPRFQQAPILTGDDDGGDDRPPNQFCERCYRIGHDDGEAYGYSRGFREGAASVRKAPLITINWSTLAGGILNIIGFTALLYAAMWIGEMRGMKSEGRLSITFSDGSAVPEKVSAAPQTPLPGTMITGSLDGEPMSVRIKGASD